MLNCLTKSPVGSINHIIEPEEFIEPEELDFDSDMDSLLSPLGLAPSDPTPSEPTPSDAPPIYSRSLRKRKLSPGMTNQNPPKKKAKLPARAPAPSAPPSQSEPSAQLTLTSSSSLHRQPKAKIY